MPADPARVKSLFLAAADLDDPAERAAYLDRECGPDAGLRARVEALLRADESPAPPDPTGACAPVAPDASDGPGGGGRAGAVIGGRYTLAEVIGEGGMGSVWRARQTEPVKRAVAVKLIKDGMDSRQVLARFEAERQALALMDHPNIARVLDGGLHEGRPYFVMELVKGVPITEFCDARKLTPRQRLELFVPVCQAIQHAHGKGVIHRDIKPSNVLVALYDDRPVPKVIDFGVAKAAGAALTERTLDTGFGAVVGTPQYMSPEQATFNNLDIDTRSDVYALGVLLYELLAGSPPFAREELEKKGLLEMLRVVREEEPPRPSAKLSTADALPTLSMNRGTEPRKLAGLLRNELDWVVMKALDKDRARRYETAAGFAADVLRYLGGEAVQAHPPSTAYRLKKFARRHKGQVVAASLLLLTLLAGVVGTSVGMAQAEGRRVEAEQARADEAERAEGERLANERAQKRLAQIQKSNEILTSIFTDLDIRRLKAGTEPLEAVLARRLVKAAGQLEGEAVGDPLVVAGLQERLGRSLLSLGHPREAIPLFLKARETRAARLGTDHPDTLASMSHLAVGYDKAGKVDLALPLYEEALRLLKARLGADHPDTLINMSNLAVGYQNAGKVDLALPLFEEALRLKRTKLGAGHPGTLLGMYNLATCYQAAGKLGLALPLYEEAAAGVERRRFWHLYAGEIVASLIACHEQLKQFEQAEAWRRKWLAVVKDRSGADSPPYAGELAALGLHLLRQKKWADAEPVLRECLALREKKQPDAWNTFDTQSLLGAALLGQKKYADAEPLLVKGYEGMKKREKAIPPQGATRIEALDRLIELYAATNKPDEAKKWRAERAKYPPARKSAPPKDKK